MEDAFEAVGAGVRTVVRHPILVVATALVLLLLVPVVAAVGLVSLVATLLVVGPLVFRFGTATIVKPLLFGGLVGASDASFDGEATLADVVNSLEDGRGLSLAGAYALQELGLVAVGISLVVLYFAGQAAGNAVGMSYSGLQVWGGAVWVLGLAIYAVVAATLQFVDVAAVLDDASATQSLRRSYELTRERPTEVAGYTVLRVALVGVSVLPGVVILAAGSSTMGTPSPLELVGWTASVLLLPFGFAAAVATHVAYYRTRDPRRR